MHSNGLGIHIALVDDDVATELVATRAIITTGHANKIHELRSDFLADINVHGHLNLGVEEAIHNEYVKIHAKVIEIRHGWHNNTFRSSDQLLMNRPNGLVNTNGFTGRVSAYVFAPLR